MKLKILEKGERMGIKTIVAKQYRDKVNQAFERFDDLPMPPVEGWIRTIRKALGMSGVQLAKRLSVTKSQVFKTEKAELSGRVTMKTMQSMAEAMNCRFVYAIVPEQDIEGMIKKRALEKADAQVNIATAHMALEAQALTFEQSKSEVERLADEMVQKVPADLWSDE